jgi:hypothetical protein
MALTRALSGRSRRVPTRDSDAQAGRLFQVEYRAQRDVDFHQLFRAESAGEVAGALGVDGGRLLNQHADLCYGFFDLVS